MEQIGTWNVVLSGSSTARKKLPRSSVTKKYRRRKKIFFLRKEEEQQHKSRGLTLLHEHGELLDGLLGGDRHCRRRWAWRGQKPGLFRFFFSSLFLPFLPLSLAFLLCSCALPHQSPHHQTAWMCGAVGLSNGGPPVILRFPGNRPPPPPSPTPTP